MLSNKTTEFFIYFSILTMLVLLVQLGYIDFMEDLSPSISERGQFGDMFGGLTALFSGLAFSATASMLFLQYKELRLQREELALSRSIQKASAQSQSELVDKQLLTAKIQGLSSLVNTNIQSATAQLPSRNPIEDEGIEKLFTRASHYSSLLESLLMKEGLDTRENCP
jgi:hypothetical protein